MKNMWLVFAGIILLIAGCSEKDGPDPPIINPEEVNLIINTVLPEGLTVSGLELCFACKGNNNIPIQPGIDTITFTKNEAEELLGREPTTSLVVYEPQLSGLPCQILPLTEINFVVKKINNLNWVLEVKPESISLMLITNVVFPEIITYTAIWVDLFIEGNGEIVYSVSKGIDTIFFSGQQAIDLLGDSVRFMAIILNPEINGNDCFPYCNNHEEGIAHITLQAKNELEWIFALPE